MGLSARLNGDCNNIISKITCSNEQKQIKGQERAKVQWTRTWQAQIKRRQKPALAFEDADGEGGASALLLSNPSLEGKKKRF